MIRLITFILLMLVKQHHMSYISSSSRLVQLVEVESKITNILKSYIGENSIDIEQVNMYVFSKYW